MKDIIKKAVEYADEWQVTRRRGRRVRVLAPNGDGGDYPLSDIGYIDRQWVLDALAAQLVRQIDAMGPHYNIFHHKWTEGKQDPRTILVGLRSPIMSYHEILAEVEGPDRTMNTLTACVEFYEGQDNDR